jgi:glycosyltransferase involved in cell wall biosynthesis
MTTVSVVMPVYNGAAYLAQAIQSVLAQSFTDFELLVIDDGSTDESAPIALAFTDPRIKVLHNGANRGLVHSRNRGIDTATGTYIAFLDADDVARPQRLQRQLLALERDATLAAVGSSAQPIDAKGLPRSYVWRMPGSPAYCEAMLLFRQWFNTSAFFVRGPVIRSLRFSDHVQLAEDLDLYVRMTCNSKVQNLDEVLIDCRVHAQSTTHTRREELRAALASINRAALREVGIDPTEEELVLHRSIEWNDEPADATWLRAVEDWLLRLRAANLKSRRFDGSAFKQVLSENWLFACEHASRHGLRSAVIRFAASPLGGRTSVSPARVAKLALRPFASLASA